MLVWEHLSLDVIDAGDGEIQSVFSLADGIRCALLSYAPRVAPLRASTLAGGGSYAEVEETLSVLAIGQSAARCAANTEAIVALLDQAARWWEGEVVAPVQLRGRIQQSTVGDLASVILGVAPGQEPIEVDPQANVQLPDGGTVPWAQPLTLRLIRRGLWLRAFGLGSGDDTGSVPDVVNPDPASIAFAQGDHDQVSPLAIGLENENATFTAGMYVLWADTANEASGSYKVDLATMAGATAAGFANQTDTLNLPYNSNNVLRYTPASTSFATSGAPTFSTVLNVLPGTIAIFAAVRNNAASVSWLIRAVANLNGTLLSPAAPVRTRPVVVDTSSQTPRIIALGVLSAGQFIGDLRLEVAAESLVGSPTLDISYIAMVAINEPGSGVVQIDPTLAATDERQIIAGALANLPQPAVVNSGTSPTSALFRVPYSGNAEAQATNAGVRVAILGTNSTFWRITTGGSPHQFTMRAARRRAYRTPQ